MISLRIYCHRRRCAVILRYLYILANMFLPIFGLVTLLDSAVRTFLGSGSDNGEDSDT